MKRRMVAFALVVGLVNFGCGHAQPVPPKTYQVVSPDGKVQQEFTTTWLRFGDSGPHTIVYYNPVGKPGSSAQVQLLVPHNYAVLQKD